MGVLLRRENRVIIIQATIHSWIIITPVAKCSLKIQLSNSHKQSDSDKQQTLSNIDPKMRYARASCLLARTTQCGTRAH